MREHRGADRRHAVSSPFPSPARLCGQLASRGVLGCDGRPGAFSRAS
jgi:hypothetical protein